MYRQNIRYQIHTNICIYKNQYKSQMKNNTNYKEKIIYNFFFFNPYYFFKKISIQLVQILFSAVHK